MEAKEGRKSRKPMKEGIKEAKEERKEGSKKTEEGWKEVKEERKGDDSD